MTISVPDFPAFFDAVWRDEDAEEPFLPFPWQQELAARVGERGDWPALLDIPTGAGKTAAIDIALWALAKQPDVAPRRIVYVVDRRLIVDQVGARVRRIRERLTKPERSHDSESLVAVASQLRRLFGSDGEATGPPIRSIELRGGTAVDPGWITRPDAPLVIVSTVDQVGSRLLHRGYGVSQGMRPIHAGLVGNDVLYLLDEVHLSQPFAETLEAIRTRYRPPAGSGVPDRFGVVALSATASTGGEAFVLDRSVPQPPTLARRLEARKLATLHVVGKATQRAEEALPERLADLAVEHPGCSAVIVNRVETARRTAALLRRRLGEARVLLVTGRMRPHDRDRLLEQWEVWIASGRNRSLVDGQRVVVGTQCLEVGADLDFDGLVTEAASWDALRQRFGRVDRLGERDPDDPARVDIVASKASLKGDPIYGEALAATVAALAELDGPFDVGLSCDLGLESEEFIAPRSQAPLLLDVHRDTFAMTSPTPLADADPALWLHGDERPSADVELLWRSDLSDELLDAVAASDEVRAEVATLFEHLPPHPAEAVSVPLAAVRDWLLGEYEAAVADVEGADLDDEEQGSRRRPSRRRSDALLLVSGREFSVVRAGDPELRPGAVLVAPAMRGGLSHGSWDPTSKDLVHDVAELVPRRERRPVARVRSGAPSLPAPDLLRPLDEQVLDAAGVRRSLDPALGERVPGDFVEPLGIVDLSHVVVRDGGSELVEDLVYLVELDVAGREVDEFDSLASLRLDSTDEANSFTGTSVLLREHCESVGDVAAAFAHRLGCPPAIVADLRLAGRLHDLGKADERFQRMLHGGDEIARLQQGEGKPLAKSSRARAPRRERAVLDPRGGYPRGARHEAMSLGLIAADAEVLAAANDPDLVRYLVASHHGHARPWFSDVVDDDPVKVEVTVDVDGHSRTLVAMSDHDLARVGSGTPDLFFDLLDRYGWFGLVWLEMVFRLGDHRQSELEQEAAR